MKQDSLLLVDDDRLVLDAMADWLREKGYSVAEASTCRDAIRLTDETAFDLVLADIRLQDGDGFEILLALDNPAADLTVKARVITASETEHDQSPSYRIKRAGEPRSAATSLTLEVVTDRDAYLTIVDVDSEGGINLLFPNTYQKPGFLKNGFVTADTPIRIPDSLQNSNEAGFHWDYGPPIGRDTIRVFASEKIPHAGIIRRLIAEAAKNSEVVPGAARAAMTRGVSVARSEAPTEHAASQEPEAGEWAATSVVIEVRE